MIDANFTRCNNAQHINLRGGKMFFAHKSTDSDAKSSLRARIVNAPTISGKIEGNVNASIGTARGVTAENFESVSANMLELAKDGIVNSPTIEPGCVVNGNVDFSIGCIDYSSSSSFSFSSFRGAFLASKPRSQDNVSPPSYEEATNKTKRSRCSSCTLL